MTDFAKLLASDTGYIWLDPPSSRIYFCDDPTCDCLGSDVKGHRGICTGIKWPKPPEMQL